MSDSPFVSRSVYSVSALSTASLIGGIPLDVVHIAERAGHSMEEVAKSLINVSTGASHAPLLGKVNVLICTLAAFCF